METDIKIGRYKHFKGGEYKVVCVAMDADTLEEPVGAPSLFRAQGKFLLAREATNKPSDDSLFVRSDKEMIKIDQSPKGCGPFRRLTALLTKAYAGILSFIRALHTAKRASNAETGRVCQQAQVVYQGLYHNGETGDHPIFVRSLAEFTEKISRPGYEGPRFSYLGEDSFVCKDCGKRI